MRRFLISAVPLFVAAAVVVLLSPSLRAQQEHDHAAAASTGQSCACCGNSGTDAMNHTSGSGCCGPTAATATSPAGDHSEHAPASAAPAQKSTSGAGAGCCSNMAANQSAAAGSKAMEHGAGGCCAGMTAAGTAAAAQENQGARGCCGSMAMGKGEGSAMPMGDASMMSDMQVFHYLLANRADIRRTVKMLPNGIDTLTESDKPEIAAKLKGHVSAMYARLKDGRPIHQRDPLFRELFAHADQIDANITYTEKGLRVVETSTDPAVAKLLHKHAEVVNGFLENGMAEMMKNHSVE